MVLQLLKTASALWVVITPALCIRTLTTLKTRREPSRLIPPVHHPGTIIIMGRYE